MQIYSPTLGGTRFLMFLLTTNVKKEPALTFCLLPSGSTSSHPLSINIQLTHPSPTSCAVVAHSSVATASARDELIDLA